MADNITRAYIKRHMTSGNDDGSLSKKGHVQLLTSTTSTSEAHAATPKAVQMTKQDLEILIWMGDM